MPVDLARYPKNWKEISHRIRFERAGGKCEWCGIPHGAIGYREPNGDFVQLAASKKSAGMEVESAALVDGKKIVRIVLTTAHLGTVHADGSPGDKHDKLDCRDENLAALCNRCHLRFDIDEHIANAAASRAKKRREEALAIGQQELF